MLVRILSNENRGEEKPLTDTRVGAKELLDSTRWHFGCFECLRFKEPTSDQLYSKTPSDDCRRESGCAGPIASDV